MCCYIKVTHTVDTFPYAQFNHSCPHLELQCLKIQIGKNKSLVLPPTGNLKTVIDWLNTVFDHLSSIRRIDIGCIGDFNVDWLKTKDSKTLPIKLLIKTWKLTQSISSPTRVTVKSASLIDLILHNLSDYTFADVVYLNISDHFPITICKKGFE